MLHELPTPGPSSWCCGPRRRKELPPCDRNGACRILRPMGLGNATPHGSLLAAVAAGQGALLLFRDLRVTRSSAIEDAAEGPWCSRNGQRRRVGEAVHSLSLYTLTRFLSICHDSSAADARGVRRPLVGHSAWGGWLLALGSVNQELGPVSSGATSGASGRRSTLWDAMSELDHSKVAAVELGWHPRPFEEISASAGGILPLRHARMAGPRSVKRSRPPIASVRRPWRDSPPVQDVAPSIGDATEEPI
jgi:hypothetical protein